MSKKQKMDEFKKREMERIAMLEKAERGGKWKGKKALVKDKMLKVMPKPNPKEPVTWKEKIPKKNMKTEVGRKDTEKSVAGRIRKLQKIKSATVYWYLAWGLSIFIITLSSVILIVFGIRFGRKKSFVWIATFISGIVTDSIIFEPVKIILIAVILAFILKRSNSDLTVMEIHYDEVTKKKGAQFDWKRCLKIMWHTRLTAPYRPVLTTRILKIRALYGSRRVWYLVYYAVTLLLLLFIVILMMQALGVYGAHQGLRQIITYFREDSDQVNTKERMYKLLHYNVIPALHRAYWYNKQKLLPLEGRYTMFLLVILFYRIRLSILVSERKAIVDDPRFTSNVKGYSQDYTNKLLGVPRLRQLRVNKHEIKIAQVFSNYFQGAYSHYSQFREDKVSYLPEWTKPEKWYEDISQLWHYSSMKLTKTGYNHGQTGWVYSGAGYVVPLSWNLGNSWRTITRLELENWADNRTRAVFFEANLYNNNLKLFTELRFVIEVLSNGVYTSRLMSRAASFFFVTNVDAKKIIILTVFMALVLLVHCVFVVSQISKDSCVTYFSDIRGYFDILMLGLGFSVVTHFFLRALKFSLFMDELEGASHDSYTSLFTPLKINEDTHVIIGIFSLVAAMALTVLTYQAMWPKQFYSVVSAIYGLLLALVVANVTISYLIHYTSYSVDREPLQIFFLHTILRDHIFTVRGDEANTRLFYVVTFPLIIVVTKFNAACVIFLHLWNSEQTHKRATRKKKSEKEKSKNRGAVRLKGSSSVRNILSQDVLMLRIQKLRVSLVSVL